MSSDWRKQATVIMFCCIFVLFALRVLCVAVRQQGNNGALFPWLDAKASNPYCFLLLLLLVLFALWFVLRGAVRSG